MQHRHGGHGTGFSTSLVGIPDMSQGNGKKIFEVIMAENSRIEETARIPNKINT